MRKLWPLLLALSVLLAFALIAAQADSLDDEEEISLFDFQAEGAAEDGALSGEDAQDGEDQAQPEPTPEPVIQADGSTMITLTAVGDVTIGRNVQHSGASIFEKELKKQGGDINFIFRNVKDIFSEDDLTIANFEGVLADSYTIPSNKKGNSFLFLGPPSYAEALSNNSVEAVTMENNHVGDFGQDGIDATIAAMESNGILWANKNHMAYFEAQGIRVGMLAYQTLNQSLSSNELKDLVASDIAKAKETCDIVTVSFHWGEELDYAPRSNQIMLGRAAIDAGADLVIGHHSHRINPIEYYKGRYIVYSLANCSFAGNNKPSDMFTFIFQVRFKMKDGEVVGTPFRIIPCRISSRKDYNDFAITPLTEPANITTVLNTLTNKSNIKNLEYAVTTYPLEWE